MSVIKAEICNVLLIVLPRGDSLHLQHDSSNGCKIHDAHSNTVES